MVRRAGGGDMETEQQPQVKEIMATTEQQPIEQQALTTVEKAKEAGLKKYTPRDYDKSVDALVTFFFLKPIRSPTT